MLFLGFIFNGVDCYLNYQLSFLDLQLPCALSLKKKQCTKEHKSGAFLTRSTYTAEVVSSKPPMFDEAFRPITNSSYHKCDCLTGNQEGKRLHKMLA
jgi:hypothetical protein